jgi:hypothetical protein
VVAFGRAGLRMTWAVVGGSYPARAKGAAVSVVVVRCRKTMELASPRWDVYLIKALRG